MKRFILLLALACVASAAAAQVGEKSLEGYFRSPLDGPLIPSGNFAETRSSHFHSGVDIKTGGVEGKQLYTAADGYISRIGIVPGGFGRVLYINHPNGTTTVYAHMQKFSDEVEKYVRAQRYRQKKHNVDLYLDAKTFPVKKGDRIGLAGNSGRSSGPHLHFEVRDAATQEPLNPITRGAIVMKDDISPTILGLHYIEVDTVGGVPLNMRPRAVEVVRVDRGRYAMKDTAALEVGARGYFVLEVTDRKNDTQNTMGVYRVALRMNGEQLFGFALDRFSFANTRYVNSLCHFGMQRGSRNQMLRLALQENNRLPVFSKMKNRGLVMLHDRERHAMEIEVEDDNGNVSTLEFVVRRRETDRHPLVQDGLIINCHKPFTARTEGLSVEIPEGALYESIFYSHGLAEASAVKSSMRRFSPVYSVLDPSIPLHKTITVSIDASEVPARLREKACLGVVSADGTTISYAGGAYKDGRVSGNSSVFGRFCIVSDTIPPTITPNFTNGQDLRDKNSIAFTVRDNFSGIASFTATIDGEWIIFEQNVMNNTITHFFDPEKVSYNGTKHTLVLTVTDGKGNSASVRRDFVR